MTDYHETTTEKLLERNARKHPEILAVKQDETRISYSQLNEKAGALALGLMKLGIKKGDRVGIWLENHAEWTVAWFGISRAGAIAIPMDYWYKSSEAEYILWHSGAKAVVITEGVGKIDFPGMLGEIYPKLPELKHIIAIDKGVKTKDKEKLRNQKNNNNPSGKENSTRIQIQAKSENSEEGENCFPDNKFPDNKGPGIHHMMRLISENPDWLEDEELHNRRHLISPEDVAFILYTSGTTGKPKGAQLTHRNICTNARAVSHVLKLTTEDNILIPVPFSHCFGCVLGITVASAASCSITPMFAFEPKRALELIEKEKVTLTHGVPTMFIRMLNALDETDFDVSTLRTGIMAGAPCPEDTMEGVLNRMDCNITIAYGLTEASPVITMTHHEDQVEKRISTVGTPLPEIEVRIVDDYNHPLPLGEVGELCCRGPNVMSGYYHDPVKTDEAIDGKGWLHSGDLAVKDEDGYYAIVGRKKDMVIVGGFNVYPKEIEEYLITFKDIVNVAVIGLPDHDLGEVVCAVIESDENKEPTEQDIVDRCYGKMASAKVPRFVVFMDSIPVSGRGKIQKFKLRETLTKSMRDGEIKKFVPSGVKEK